MVMPMPVMVNMKKMDSFDYYVAAADVGVDDRE